MAPSAQSIVHRVLAFQFGLRREGIKDTQRLRQDLGLDSFDLVQIALWLEEVEPDRGEFPITMIDPAMMVGELCAVFQAWLEAADGEREPEEEVPDTLRVLQASVAPPTLRSGELSASPGEVAHAPPPCASAQDRAPRASPKTRRRRAAGLSRPRTRTRAARG